MSKIPLEKVIFDKLNDFEYTNKKPDWDSFEKKLSFQKTYNAYKIISIAASITIITLLLFLNNNSNKHKSQTTNKQITRVVKQKNKVIQNKDIISSNLKDAPIANNYTKITEEKSLNHNPDLKVEEKTHKQNNEEIIVEQGQEQKQENLENTIKKQDNQYIPVSEFKLTKQQACAPFNGYYEAIDNHIDINFTWKISDGFSATGKSVKHTFKKSGKYTIELIAEYNGNKTSTKKEITVYENPQVSFSYTVDDNTYYFDGPDDGKTIWNFQYGNIITETDPVFTFTNIGKTKVTLTYINENSCKSIYSETIEIQPVFQIANAFSPDNNGFNDSFGPIFEYPENYNYDLYIYNSKGNLIYKSETVNHPWNGKFKNTEQSAKKDIYLWKLIIKDKFGNKIIKNGNVRIK